MNDITRRQFLGNAALGLAAAFVGLPAAESAAAVVELPAIRTEGTLVFVNKSSKTLTLRTLGDMLCALEKDEFVRLDLLTHEVIQKGINVVEITDRKEDTA